MHKIGLPALRTSHWYLLRHQRFILPGRRATMSQSNTGQPSSHMPCSTASIASSSRPMSLLARVRALDRSKELSGRYTPLVLYHPCPSASADSDTSSPYVAVGHAETSLIQSSLIHSRDDRGDPVFLITQLPDKFSAPIEVLRLRIDVEAEKNANNGSSYTHAKLFQERTTAFDHVTTHLCSTGVIKRRHSDAYPIYPFTDATNTINNASIEEGKRVVLAHINRSAAPYLGFDSVGVHLHCYVRQKCGGAGGGKGAFAPLRGVWLAKRAPTKSHHPNFWDPTVAGGQPVELSIIDNVVKEAHEEAGVPSEWIKPSNTANAPNAILSDHTQDPLTITTAKEDGSCMKRSLYYSCDLEVPSDWIPTAVDGEVSEFKLYSMSELEDELRFGNIVRPAMRAVLLDFMVRHGALKGDENVVELRAAMRQKRLVLWQ
ncbi:hypothetical protein ACHAWF_015883 [Thalassiosira exigua]